MGAISPRMARKSILRYQIFVKEYCIDLNGKRAAMAAGYSELTAASQASRLLTNRNVQRLLRREQIRRASKLDLKAESVVEELRRLGFSNMMDYMRIGEDGDPKIDLSALTRDQAAAIQEIREDTTGGSGDGERKQVIRTTFKLADKKAALELLGRHLGMFQDNLKVTGLDGLADQLNQLRTRKHAPIET